MDIKLLSRIKPVGGGFRVGERRILAGANSYSKLCELTGSGGVYCRDSSCRSHKVAERVSAWGDDPTATG